MKEDKKALDEASASAKAALESGGLEELEAAKTALEQVAHKLAEKVYAQSAEGGSAGPGDGAGPGPDAGGDSDDDVIDAEFDTK